MFCPPEVQITREEMVQCHLTSNQWNQIAWIPRKFAVVGKLLKLHGDPGKWTVSATYAKANKRFVENLQHNAGDIWVATSGPSPIGHK